MVPRVIPIVGSSSSVFIASELIFIATVVLVIHPCLIFSPFLSTPPKTFDDATHPVDITQDWTRYDSYMGDGTEVDVSIECAGGCSPFNVRRINIERWTYGSHISITFWAHA